MIYISILIVFLVGSTYYFFNQSKYITYQDNSKFSIEWRNILLKNVEYYDFLSPEDKKLFEIRILEFLANFRITGIKATITALDELLVASSAIIPTFRIKGWRYTTLDEVLIYPRAFSSDFNFDNKKEGQRIAGMVGNGPMEGKMILSQKSLRGGFSNDNDKKNVGVHEFVHLIDKEDGSIDGIPKLLLEHAYVIPWVHLVKEKMAEIQSDSSDINPYGSTNQEEFFTVTSEYFFERPELMKTKHPALYLALSDVFSQNLAQRWKGKKRSVVGKNELCPCGSGKKFKYCCGKVHFSK